MTVVTVDIYRYLNLDWTKVLGIPYIFASSRMFDPYGSFSLKQDFHTKGSTIVQVIHALDTRTICLLALGGLLGACYHTIVIVFPPWKLHGASRNDVSKECLVFWSIYIYIYIYEISRLYWSIWVFHIEDGIVLWWRRGIIRLEEDHRSSFQLYAIQACLKM